MNSQFLLGLLLTLLPVFELRAGLPVIVDYALKNNLFLFPLFLLVIFLNILVIFIAYFLLDFLNKELDNVGEYHKIAGMFLKRIRKKAKKIDSKIGFWKYFALTVLVAIPLPGTGAWTGTIVAWILGLSRQKSFIAISVGVLIAGVLVLAASLGAFRFFY